MPFYRKWQYVPVLMLGLVGFAHADWPQVFDSANHFTDTPSAVSVDPLGNVLVGGTTVQGFELQDLLIVKYDTFGNFKWSQTFGAVSDDDRLQSIRGDSGGNVYVLSSTLFWDQFGKFNLRKFSSSGVLQWQITIPGTGFNGRPRCDLQLSTDDLPIVLTTDPNTEGGASDRLTKVKKNGVVQWTTTYRPAGAASAAVSLAVAPDGSLIVGGTTGTDPIGHPQFEIIKFDSNGTYLWERHGSSSDRYDGTVALRVDPGGHIYLAATSFALPVGRDDWFVVKFNPDGSKIFQDRVGLVDDDEEVTGLAVTDAGEVYVGGNWQQGSPFNRYYKLVKYGADGTRQWAKTYRAAPASDAYTVGVEADSDGNAYLSGMTWPAQNALLTTVKYTSSGARQFVRSIDSAIATATAYDRVRNKVYAVGTISGSSSTDFVIERY